MYSGSGGSWSGELTGKGATGGARHVGAWGGKGGGTDGDAFYCGVGVR